MADKGKPKSALAGLLDSLHDKVPLELEEAEVSVAVTDDSLQGETPTVTLTAPTVDAAALQKLSTENLKVWEYADRPIDEMGDISALAKSITTHGQQEPILVRPTTDTTYRYEVIFGNRRFRACQMAKVPVIAIVKRMTDQEAAVFQKEENENRKGLSDFAKATSYRKQIDAGIFKTERELANELGMSLQSLNDIFAFIRIPVKVRESIPNFKTLSRRMAVKLATLCKDKTNIPHLIKLAGRIGNKSITSATIEKVLADMLLGNVKAKREPLYREVVRKPDGEILFTLKETATGAVQCKIDKALQGKYDVKTLKTKLYQYLLGEQ